MALLKYKDSQRQINFMKKRGPGYSGKTYEHKSPFPANKTKENQQKTRRNYKKKKKKSSRI